jgi:glucose uptake protein
MIGALWGVFVWKEFKSAPSGTHRLLTAMFLFYVLGLATLVASRH